MGIFRQLTDVALPYCQFLVAVVDKPIFKDRVPKQANQNCAIHHRADS